MILIVSPPFVLRCLLYAISFLFILNCFAQFYVYTTEINSISLKIINWLSFDREANIPTFYSAVNLCFSALLLFLIAGLQKKVGNESKGWSFLGFVFLFLAFDEAASIHEALIGITQRTLNTTGFFHYAWFIPYGIGLVILCLIYIPFFKKLPKRSFFLFVTSGLIFVSGAIGFEMIGGKIREVQGHSVLYALCFTLEETLEMLGVALFIYSLLDYIASSLDPVIKIGKGKQAFF